MIVILAGGVGAAKLLSGMVQVVSPDNIVAIVNTGDDASFFGLHVSPDLDIVAYTLAGIVDREHGWGVQQDSFACLKALGTFGHDTWFQLGDRDLATHIHRTLLLNQGLPLSVVTADIARSLGLRVRLLPMSDQPVATHIVTPTETVPFQEYMVHRGCRDVVRDVIFEGVDEARPAPGVLEAIAEATGIVICPSNPIISIGTILAVRGIRDALRQAPAPVIAVSPIVGGAAIKGPADRMLRDLGYESSAFGVAELYRDFVDVFIVDRADEALVPRIAGLGMRVVAADTIMAGPVEKAALAARVVDAFKLVQKTGIGRA